MPAAAWTGGHQATQSTGARSLLAPVTVGVGLALVILTYTAGALKSLDNLELGIVWALIMLAAFIGATFLAPSTPSARGIAAGLFALSALLYVIAIDKGYQNLRRSLFVLIDVIGLAGWLILRRRKPLAFIGLIPALIFAVIWNADWEPGRWLQDLPDKIGLPYDYNTGRSFSFTALVWETWAYVDWFVVGLLALAAVLVGTLPPPAPRTFLPPPGGGYPSGYPAPGYAPSAYSPGYQQPGYQQPGYQQPGYQQPGYQQPGYQQPVGYQQPGYQQPGYQQPGYPPAGYQQPGYQQPGQPPAGYPPASYPPA